ncbi:methylated-DNA--[protein]-cysteine S-methyltransferase [Dyella sp. EPa41]|uniref:methylated-DNA--[protein]-cysteine S-methyltransferase n=1 Tax=Dyella sp. EPa41 TaxID=1561194 RepID=UPI0019167035|nr:methylated-DNA--[protein]-cysteine S-methyltransferase [Dyella sp. EPa41]
MNVRQRFPFACNFRAPGNLLSGAIGYAFGESSLGTVVVARSLNGVCAIFLGNDADALCRDLISAFPAGELVAEQTSLQHEVDHIVAFIDKGTVEGTITLDIGGTRFEQQVWKQLCAIPEGETRSYSDIAQAMGSSASTRAVAAACAANLLAVVIPCHRVVRKDGYLSGYRWGVERKRTLLVEEGAR